MASNSVSLARDQRKRSGAYYTPAAVARFLARWAIRTGAEISLEPSAGDGSILEAASSRYEALNASASGRLFAVEIDEAAAGFAQSTAPKATVIVRNFLDLSSSEIPRPSVIIGNPPFIRYQNMSAADRQGGKRRASESGVELSGLASSWAHFLVYAMSFLPRDQGRLALVLPSELFHADYAVSVRAHLVGRFRSITTVSFDRPVFEDATVDVVLLLADTHGPPGRHSIRVTSADALDALDPLATFDGRRQRSHPWVKQRTAEVYGRLVDDGILRPLTDYATVDIGVVTGANEFFVIDEAKRSEFQLPISSVQPIIERSRHILGMQAHPTESRWLFRPPTRIRSDLDEMTSSYIRVGEAARVDAGYKCSRRKPWWMVPLPSNEADLLLPYLVHTSLRLVANPMRLRATNLIHSVTLKSNDTSIRGLAAASLSSAAALSAEMEGRAYAGGVLKLEPRDAESLCIPSLDRSRNLESLFPILDRLVATGRMALASRLVDEALGIDHDLVQAELAVARLDRLRATRRRRRAHDQSSSSSEVSEISASPSSSSDR